jgi:heme/copper-type cytochrome/quinol oxidase subunit 3
MKIIDSVLDRRPQSESEFALRFFFLSFAVFGAAGALALGLIHFVRYGGMPGRLIMPPAFWITSAALLVGSGVLHRALRSVRTERQAPFRRSLLIALGCGTIFAGVQVYGLWCLLKNLAAPDAAMGAGAFVFVLAALHGMHFTVALLFLAFVTLRAFADRYDHEYYWGVMVCTFFWHGLAWIWLCILAVFACAALTGSMPAGPLQVN